MSALDVGGGDEGFDERLEATRVRVAEAALERAVEVEHADHLATGDHGDNHLAPRGGVAGDVSGKRVDIRDHDRLAVARGRAAHALANGDAHARRLALE